MGRRLPISGGSTHVTPPASFQSPLQPQRPSSAHVLVATATYTWMRPRHLLR